MRKKLQSVLNSPYWKVANSAVVVLLIGFLLTLNKKTDSISQDSLSLKADIKQALTLSNELSVQNNNEIQIVNQNVTKVEKEIANLKETIDQFYESSKGILFDSSDLDERVKVFDLEDRRVIFFELPEIPIPNSVSITSSKGSSSPATYICFHNIVSLRTKAALDKVLRDDSDFYFIRYHQNFSEDQEMVTVKNMEYKGTMEEPHKSTFKKIQ